MLRRVNSTITPRHQAFETAEAVLKVTFANEKSFALQSWHADLRGGCHVRCSSAGDCRRMCPRFMRERTRGSNSRSWNSTQGNVGPLGIGVGYVGGGPYLDENGVRRDGLHASLAISVQDKPSAFQQPDVHEGQTLEAAGYRILIDKIILRRSGQRHRAGLGAVTLSGP